MNKATSIVIVVALIAAVCGVIIYKHYNSVSLPPNNNQISINKVESQGLKALPRLVDLGADQCIPCKMMAPILEELKTEYAGRFQVDFIDVWKDPEQARIYGIRVIPTQIFYNASGKELFRHEGFISREDILARWKELGVELTKTE